MTANTHAVMRVKTDDFHTQFEFCRSTRLIEPTSNTLLQPSFVRRRRSFVIAGRGPAYSGPQR